MIRFPCRIAVSAIFLCFSGINLSFAAARIKLNIIIICLDTLRADHLSCYGYKEVETPVIDSFANKGVLFEKAYSHETYTLPSHASLFTSLLPWTHQINDIEKAVPRSQFPLTLAECYQKEGYETVAFTGGGLVAGEYGFSKGFESYEQDEYRVPPHSFESAKKWMMKRGALTAFPGVKPFFLFYHTYEMSKLGRYKAEFGINCSSADKFVRILPNLYDNSLRWVDAEVDEILQILKGTGLDASTIVVIISDHGESFCEVHNNGRYIAFAHGHPPYQEQIHVPLIIRVPPGLDPHIRPSRRIKNVVGLIDVAPTLLDLCGIKVPKEFHGISLAPLLKGMELAGRPLIASGETAITILYKNKKYFHFEHAPKLDEYYDLDSDPLERKNIANTGGNAISELKSLLFENAQRGGWGSQRYQEKDKIKIKSESINLLKSLGYLK